MMKLMPCFVFLALSIFASPSFSQDSSHCSQMRRMLEDAIAARDGFIAANPNAPQSSKDAMQASVRAMQNSVASACRPQCNEQTVASCDRLLESINQVNNRKNALRREEQAAFDALVEGVYDALGIYAGLYLAAVGCPAAVGVAPITGGKSIAACISAFYLFRHNLRSLDTDGTTYRASMDRIENLRHEISLYEQEVKSRERDGLTPQICSEAWTACQN